MKKELSLAFGMLLFAYPATAQHLPTTTTFKVKPLISDQQGKAPVVDPNLVDAWGLAQGPGGPLWVADNGTGLSTVYDRKSGQIQSLVVTIPSGNPTGTVFVPSNITFNVTENGKTGAAVFLFDSEAGVISGWAPSVDGTNAIPVPNTPVNAVYKGLALDTKTQWLYAADFFNNAVEVFDTNFNVINTFTDSNLTGYAPFNIVDVKGMLYVSFAKQDSTKKNEVDGQGLGYVDVFNTSGQLVKQLVAHGELNAPWGMAIASKTWGTYAGTLLVGNFGNGWINAYDPTSGKFIGSLSDSSGAPLAIDGLWALDPGPGKKDLTFSSGPSQEAHGLVGLISPNK
jgi:uncharacterized protein (TIGR03118 family)